MTTETCAEKAQRLVGEGRVSITRVVPWVIEALVEEHPDIHTVNVFATGRYYCTCDWGDYHSYTDDLCAHALAVKLAAEREQGP